ncbi:RNA-directed DNA polymerase, eukaryota, reverse transcriptase zinc-binding domain protein [Tanacetum coccineum]
MKQSPKTKEVRQVIYDNNLCLCVILESHVANSNLQVMCSKFCKHWHWTSNGLSCVKGSMIILGWNPNIVKVVGISYDAHVCIRVCTLKMIRRNYFAPLYMLITGDFNVSLSVDDKSTSTSYIDIGMRHFQECVEDLELSDVNSTGLRFTWNQKPKGGDGILKKIGRIMANLEF